MTEKYINIDNSKFFILWLVSHFPNELDSIGAELLKIAQDCYGSSATSVGAVKLQKWAAPRGEGGGHVPKWVYLAALDLAIEKGFVPSVETEKAILDYCNRFKSRMRE